MAIAPQTAVSTPYGEGVINAYREQDQVYQIQLTNWELSDGQKVHIFAQESQITVKAEEKKEEVAAVVAEEKKEEVVAEAAVVVEEEKKKEEEVKSDVLAVGTKVSTPYGKGAVESYREENQIYKVQLTNWELSEGQKVYIFCQKTTLTVEEGAKEEAKTEEAAVEVTEAAEEKKDDEIDTEVTTPYGEGKIVAYREEDKMYQIQLTNWEMTEGQKVYIFCQRATFEPKANNFDATVDSKLKNVKHKEEKAGCCNIM